MPFPTSGTLFCWSLALCALLIACLRQSRGPVGVSSAPGGIRRHDGHPGQALVMQSRSNDNEVTQPVGGWGASTTQAAAGGGEREALAATVALAEAAHSASSLGAALSRVGSVLQSYLGTRALVRLRLEDWNGETALVRPWGEAASGGVDHIDISSLGTLHRSDHPIGSAVARGESVIGEPVNGAAGSNEFVAWRPRQVSRAIAIPVLLENIPVAALELYDPVRVPAQLAQVLEVARVQLGFVAQRDANRAHMASSAEHLSRLALVASRISSGVAITDRAGTIEWVNGSLLALTGWPAADVLGNSVAQLLLGEPDGRVVAEELRLQFERGQPFRLEYQGTRPGDGARTAYWGEIDAIQMLDEIDGRSQYVCLFTDISERKQREQQREMERAFLEALMENLPVSLFVIEPADLRLVALNRYAELEFRLDRNAVIGQAVHEAMGEQVLQQALPAMQEAIERHTTVERDFEWESAGERRRVNARHFALRHSNGAPRLLISLARDISQQHRAQADLEESEARFRELVESMDDCVYVASLSRDRYLYLGPQTEALWGVPVSVIERRPQALLEAVIEEDRGLSREQQEAEARLEPTDVTVRIRHPRLGQRWLRHCTRTRKLPSGEVRVYGLVSDVTESQRHALELQRARDLAEAASQAKSQFMANMSHEIRTPMNGILGMTELLLGTPLSDKQRRFAQAVYRSGESLLEIINDILDFAKIEAGKLELSPTDFVLRSVVEDTLELLAPRAHEKGLEISFREQPGLPPTVNADPLRLRQVLTNLVANAIKFTECGEVVVDLHVTRDTAASDLQPGSAISLEFTVRDTGIGIPGDVLPRLFSAFTQANGGMARRYGGTGLGLAISKQLVELMGGDIHARSSPGVGSEFSFSVPMRVSDPAHSMGDVDAMDMPALNVLVADDNETNRTIIENMLTAWGMRVTLAVDGRQALDVLERHKGNEFDLALVDMQMPNMDGIEMIRATRASGRYPDLKLILLSSVSTPDDVKRAHEVGFQRFVAKPVRKAELRQAIIGVTPSKSDSPAEMPKLHRNILVVEDNPVNQEVIGHMLRRLGCQIVVAGSALDGLRALCEQRFDLVLMDIQMPGMDGIEALNLFRRGPGGRFAFLTPADTPVVAVTANALDGDEERFLNLGFDDYLSKPFRQSQLLAVLNKRLREIVGSSTPAAQPAATQPGGLDTRPAPLAATPGFAPTAPGDLPRTEPVLDPQALKRLQELDPTGNNRLLERVLKAFETSVSRLLPMLIEARDNEDSAGIGHVAHTLKSSSASIGAIKLSHMCAEIESLIRQGTADNLGPRIDAVCNEIDLVIDNLRSLQSPR
ncbi:MAG: response regulator [Aquabacterium sp.]|nr:MAG: response regulator [Aquabacterium sp.]